MADIQISPDMTDRSAAGLELFLMTLRYKEGQLRSLEANNPVLLENPEVCYVVYTGKVDVFAVQVSDGAFVAPRRHLLRVEAGGVFFGLGRMEQQEVSLLASGVPGTKVLNLKQERLRQLAADIEYQDIVAAMLDR